MSPTLRREAGKEERREYNKTGRINLAAGEVPFACSLTRSVDAGVGIKYWPVVDTLTQAEESEASNSEKCLMRSDWIRCKVYNIPVHCAWTKATVIKVRPPLPFTCDQQE